MNRDTRRERELWRWREGQRQNEVGGRKGRKKGLKTSRRGCGEKGSVKEEEGEGVEE